MQVYRRVVCKVERTEKCWYLEDADQYKEKEMTINIRGADYEENRTSSASNAQWPK
jgi:hypothetical protein